MIKSLFMKTKIIEEKRKYKKNTKKIINLFYENKISNIIYEIKYNNKNNANNINAKREKSGRKNTEQIAINNNNNIMIFLFKLLILINIFSPLKNNIFDLYYFRISKISLKIKGFGLNSILGKYFNKSLYPNYVYINGEKQDSIECEYYFNQLENFVELIWNNSINNCKYMFDNCNNIIEINFSYFNTSLVTSMTRMFSDCFSLISLNLSNFNTSNVISMDSMLSNCLLLTSLDLSNFNTSQVQDMTHMFENCLSLISLNVSNFNTSKVITIYDMFHGCSSLISLDLSNFDTSEVCEMDSMFYNCSSLISLNFPKFKTTKTIYMLKMFYGCSSLTSLDLSHFDTSTVTDMHNIFDSCINLEFINLSNFNEKMLDTYDLMFSGVPDNIVICINENITKEKILPQILNTKCHVIDCSKDWKSKQKKIDTYNNGCVESCDKNTQYKYEYNGKCIENCSNGFLYDDNNKQLNICKCELEKCLLCPQISLKKIYVQNAILIIILKKMIH